jgi:hypothetical protein
MCAWLSFCGGYCGRRASGVPRWRWLCGSRRHGIMRNGGAGTSGAFICASTSFIIASTTAAMAAGHIRCDVPTDVAISVVTQLLCYALSPPTPFQNKPRILLSCAERGFSLVSRARRLAGAPEHRVELCTESLFEPIVRGCIYVGQLEVVCSLGRKRKP